MKSGKLLWLVSSCFLAISCSRPCCMQDVVVCETYVHPYGLEISGNEWCRQGASGDVIVTRKDGITTKSTYQNGVLDGQVSYTFPYRDTIETIEIYARGNLVKETHFFPSGIVKEEIEYQTPNERVIKRNYDQGTRKSQEHLLGDQLKNATYYNLAEVVESSVEDFSGKATQRDIYGQLQSIDTIENGIVISSTTYHPNGMPDATTPYANGVVHGVRKTFLPGGEPYTVEGWENGQKHGATIVYQDGEKIAEIPYDAGKKHGVEKHFAEEGQVVEEISWADDERHGPCSKYVEGQCFRDWFYRGSPVSQTVYEKRCRLLQCQ